MKNIISYELKISLLFSVLGIIFQSFVIIVSLNESISRQSIAERVQVLARYIYEKYGYFGIIYCSICDFYITLLLFIYMNMMLLKFFGYHMTKNKKISGHYFNDLFLIGLLCIICRFSFFYVDN